jgi:signal peptidase I
MTEPNLPKAPGDDLAKTAAERARGAGDDPLADSASEKAIAEKADKGDAARPQIDSMRETVESIAVAFILAFLFRTFVAEAFVIPTGSMATTLMGRHKDMQCPNCKYSFQASASSEADDDGNVITGAKVLSTLCPNCGFPIDTGNELEYPSYKGDRIIVSKLGLDELKRWDVVVFRYPERAGTNYIKRLVGLPGEHLRIRNGDLFAQPVDNASAPWRILRKPPEVVLAMLRDVYDNDLVVDWMTAQGWPPRWQASPMDIDALVKSGWGEREVGSWTWRPNTKSPAGSWQTDDGYRTFRTDGSASGEVWLRYQHLLAFDGDQWAELIARAPEALRSSFYGSQPKSAGNGTAAEPIRHRPPLRYIDDFTAYNYALTKGGRNTLYGQPDTRPWVGDLAISCQVKAEKPQGSLIFELIEAGHRFHCRLDLAERSIHLSIDGGQVSFVDEQGSPQSAAAAAKGAVPTSDFELLFANVDGQLLVWINGELVTFDMPTTYELQVEQPDRRTADYSPVGIASKEAEAQVSSLRIMRDTYYLAQGGGVASDVAYYPNRENEADTYPLRADQYFVLGDNSPHSADARAWPKPYVERKLLIGKALFVFWPHSWDSPVPFTPNWKRMRFIR